MTHINHARDGNAGATVEFEWDDDKDASNFVKHGIQFTEATFVFADPSVVTRDVSKPEHGKPRFIAIGVIDRGTIAVIYTVWDDKRRIISGRKAHRNERDEHGHSQTITGRDDGPGSS